MRCSCWWSLACAALLGFGVVASCGDDGKDERPGRVEEPVCGDARSPLASERSAIVNGSAQWDPSVVELSTGQALAVGALMQLYGRELTNICTATLVAPDRVLSAAHCVLGRRGRVLPAEETRFAVGADVSDPVAVFEVSKIIVHPDYDWRRPTAAHDISLLVLSTPATSVLPEIEPLPYRCHALDEAIFVGSRVQTVGYGAIDRRGMVANSRQLWAVEDVVDLSSIDFTVDGHGESGVCYGDSGGPCLWPAPGGDVLIVGTLSWGDALCADRDHFTRADRECEFLDRHMPPCGLVSQRGSCDGDVAVYCEGDAVVQRDCAAQGEMCGDDGESGMRCIPDPCGEETLAGRCTEGTAVWCEDHAIRTDECAARGDICGDDGTGRMRCTPDPCGEETLVGRCDGRAAIWCEDHAIRTDECTPGVELCGDDGQGRMRCQPDPCQGETATGRCAGGEAIWCEGGAVRVRRCPDCGQTCGWSEQYGAYYCVD